MKSGVADALIALLEPIQAEFKASEEWQKVEQQAYPPIEVGKKPKKKKKLGELFPGGKGVQVKPDENMKEEQKDHEVGLNTDLSKP